MIFQIYIKNRRVIKYLISINFQMISWAGLDILEELINAEMIWPIKKLRGDFSWHKGEQDEKNLYHYTGFGAGIRIL